MPKVILLFDMDGVLIQSNGYYTSLQSAIKLIGQTAGVKDAELDMDDISKLEAAGIYHIWDHLTFFSSILLLHIWKYDPEVRLPSQLGSAQDNNCNIPDIDFSEYTKHIDAGYDFSLPELTEYIGKNNNHLDSTQRTYIEWLVDSSREIYTSPVLPIMQEYILGSDQFRLTYDLPCQLEVGSFPEQLDRPTLTKENYEHLQNWLKVEDHHAAIFTSRPNLPPDEEYFGTPEAEIGAKIIDLGNLPIIGAGSLDWLADRIGVPARTYNKPHPVHVLAAMQAAAGRDIKTSLGNAVDIYSQPGISHNKPDWQEFSEALVYVFEDSQGGLKSAQHAAQILSLADIQVQMVLIGIGHQPDKIGTLLEVSQRVYSDINSCPLIDVISAH